MNRDKETYVIATSNDEHPFNIVYKEGTYRIYSSSESMEYWSFELDNGKVIERGIKKSQDLHVCVARLTIEDAAMLIHKYGFNLNPEGLESSGSIIANVVESIANGTYVPKKSRVTSKPVNTFAFEVKVKKTYQVVLMGYTITVAEGTDFNKFNIKYPNGQNSESLDIPVELMVPIAQLFTEII